jgi:hypothetical protein
MANTKTKQITDAEIAAKAIELTAKHNVKVTPFYFVDEGTGEKIVGYLKEPIRLVKQRAMDKMLMGASGAGEDLLTVCLIREESSPRILSELSEDDSVFLGSCNAALGLVKVMQNQLKKS